MTAAPAVAPAESRLRVPWASGRTLTAAGAWLVVAAVGYLVVIPLVRLQSGSFSDGARGYRTAFGSDSVGDVLRVTVQLALGSLAIAMVLGVLLAYASTRLPPRLGSLQVLPILPIVVPPVSAVLGWMFLLSPRPGYLNILLRKLPWWSDLREGPIDVYSVPWIIIITGMLVTSFVYLFVRSGLENINTELIEAANVHGAGRFRTFFGVILPLLRPSIMYGGGVALLLSLGQFAAPLLLGTNRDVNVLSTEIYSSVRNKFPPDYGSAAALGAPLLVAGLLIVVYQRSVLGDQARFVTHGGKSFRSRERPSRLAVVFIVAYSFVVTVLPLLALLLVALSPFWNGRIETSKLTLDNFRSVVDSPVFVDAVRTSVSVAIITALILIPLAFVIARLILRPPTRFISGVLDVLVTLPLGVPAVIFGLGFLLTYSEGPIVLYNTRWILVVVYVTLMLPFATRMQLAGMIALGDHYVEASRVSGASALQTNLRVMLPLLRPTLAGATALMFVLVSHEFTASLLVRSVNTQVMGTVIYEYYGHGSYPLVASAALVLSVITALGVLAAVLLGGRDVLRKL